MSEGRTYKTLEEVRCVFAVKSIDRFDAYLDDHPDDAEDVKQAITELANGPRNLSTPLYNYMGEDLPNSYIYPANEHIVLIYHVISLAPICILGLVAILDNREFER